GRRWTRSSWRRARRCGRASGPRPRPGRRARRPSRRRRRDRPLCWSSVGVELDPQELAADEEVVAVREIALALDAHVGAVAAVEIGEREFAAVLLEPTVRAGHVEVHGEVEIAALAADLERAAPRADRHADRAALEDLGEAERARVLRRRVE